MSRDPSLFPNPKTQQRKTLISLLCWFDWKGNTPRYINFIRFFLSSFSVYPSPTSHLSRYTLDTIFDHCSIIANDNCILCFFLYQQTITLNFVNFIFSRLIVKIGLQLKLRWSNWLHTPRYFIPWRARGGRRVTGCETWYHTVDLQARKRFASSTKSMPFRLRRTILVSWKRIHVNGASFIWTILPVFPSSVSLTFLFIFLTLFLLFFLRSIINRS